MKFQIESPYKPTGDQPQAIAKLVNSLKKGVHDQTLLGVTGSGKTFTMANIVAEVQRPTLVISHNKTLAAQLASEFRDFFPHNAIHYFVSYYDYYQPESYIPSTDTFIEKETELNEEIDRLRHAATQSLLTRRDVLIVASVSCIYGLGSPQTYRDISLTLRVGGRYPRSTVLRALSDMRYTRNEIDFFRGRFRVRGELIEVFPSFSDKDYIRLNFFGDELESISIINFITQEEGDTDTLGVIKKDEKGRNTEFVIFPATHYIAEPVKFENALGQIRTDLATQLKKFQQEGKVLEPERLKQRTRYDLEMLGEVGYVNGIENYSRYFDGRKAGEPPSTLIDFFPKDFLMFVDESHMTIPQIRGMYAGDQSRKSTLVNFGFRLPAALDNRPLNFSEFQKKIKQVVYVSATPAPYELEKSKGHVVEQLIRPTGLLDPVIVIRPTRNQIDDLLAEIQKRIKKHQRVLVTTLTKRVAEELSEYLQDIGVSSQYIHSEVDTFERLEILRDLRLGKYDVLVGINLLREGLDLPEVSMVAILDADKEGFLRSDTSLIQITGRAARHIEGTVIMYADRITRSMKTAISETNRRRKSQELYNKKHGITPRTIQKKISEDRLAGAKQEMPLEKVRKEDVKNLSRSQKKMMVQELEQQMKIASSNLEFEKAAELRDEIKILKGKKS